MSDHVHMLIGIPPGLAVTSVAGCLKCNSAIRAARHFLKAQQHQAGLAVSMQIVSGFAGAH